MIQAILVLAALLVLISLGQIPLAIFLVMGVASVLIFRRGVAKYEASKKQV